jgi:hypothetical protein
MTQWNETGRPSSTTVSSSLATSSRPASTIMARLVGGSNDSS